MGKYILRVMVTTDPCYRGDDPSVGEVAKGVEEQLNRDSDMEPTLSGAISHEVASAMAQVMAAEVA